MQPFIIRKSPKSKPNVNTRCLKISDNLKKVKSIHKVTKRIRPYLITGQVYILFPYEPCLEVIVKFAGLV